MPVRKEHKEFHKIDTSGGWQTIPGYPPGIQEKILAGSLDEKNHGGSRTRLLRFQPGIHTTAPFVHEYWEEVYLPARDPLFRRIEEGLRPCWSASPRRSRPTSIALV